MSCDSVNVFTQPVSINGTNTDAFGRLRVSEPYTLFDSSNRYAADNQFDTSIVSGGSTTYLPNEATVQMTVNTTSAAEVVRQSFRCMPYQPGKSLLVLATFVMNDPKANLRQRVGYFGTQNGVYFELTGASPGTKAFVLRSYISGSVDNTSRRVEQSAWNGDKLDGTGASGLTLDLTKPQILWMDFEWLGVGNVRCGFIINGLYIVCHTYQTANVYGSSVYITTATLPVRYEITNTGTTASSSSLKQICSSVVSEAGFEQTSIDHVARRDTEFTNIDTTATFFPIVSIRLISTALNAVVIPNRIQFLPLTNQNYEVALLKNPTLTGATWAASVPSDANVQYDVAATAISSIGTITQTDYITSSGSGGIANTSVPTGYNLDLQLGSSLAGVSDIYTLAVRTVSGATKGSGVGSLSFYDLTQ
ncbi:hypothetical protein EB001_24070 [bacterium]|nr:hypothetical protein [bacterium]